MSEQMTLFETTRRETAERLSAVNDPIVQTVHEAQAVERSGEGQSFSAWSKTLRLKLGGEALTAPMRQHSTVYACIHAKATSISGVPWLIRDSSDPDGDGPGLTNALSALFDQPNPLMSTSDFFYFIDTYMEHSGECIVVKQGKNGRLRNPTELPAELWPLNGKLFTHEVDKDTKMVKFWVMNKGRHDEVEFLPHEIIQLRYPNPYNTYRGLAPMEAAMAAMSVDWKAYQYNRAFFDNGADPGGILHFPEKIGLQPHQKREYREDWEDRHAGEGNQHRLAILDRGATYQSLGATFRDMQWTSQRTWNRNEIMTAFRTPPGVIGIYEEVNYATARQESKDFWTKTLKPIFGIIMNGFWSGLFRWVEGGKYIGVHDLSDVQELQEDIASQMVVAQSMALLGWTAEQINDRLDLGMPTNPWQKTAWGNFGMVPFPVLLDDPELGVPSGGESEEEELTAEQQLAKNNREFMARMHANRTRDKGSERREAFWHDYIKTFWAKEERRFTGMMRGYFRAMRAEVLTNLEKASTKAVRGGQVTDVLKADVDIDQVIFDAKKWKDKLADATRPHYKRTATRAAQRLANEIASETDWASNDPKIEDLTERMASRISGKDGVNETMRRQLRKTLAEGIKKNETLPQLQKRVKRTMNVSMSRAQAIARTEVGSVSNRARVIAMGEDGIKKHEWVSSRDTRVRESHQLDGEIRKIGSKFSNGLRWPHDNNAPAKEIVNCRCVSVPVVEK